jgi:transcriptional regulator with XRE-family HTH domain
MTTSSLITAIGGILIDINIDYGRIGQHLRAARKQRKYTQAFVAECLNVKESTFSNMERSQQRMNLQRIIELCVLYEIMPGTVLNDCCNELIAMNTPEVMAENPNKAALFLLINKCSANTLNLLSVLAQSLYDSLENKS